MKKFLLFLAVAGCLLSLPGLPGLAQAEVNVNVGVIVPPPPKFVFAKPPELIVVPSHYTYFVPDVSIDIIFFRDYWYRPYKGYWYRATGYNGPWVHVIKEKVPVAIINMPPDYKRVPPGHQRIPYGQLKKNWKHWEKDKHWDNRHGEKGSGHDEKEQHGGEKQKEKEDHGGGKEYKEKSKGGGKGKH